MGFSVVLVEPRLVADASHHQVHDEGWWGRVLLSRREQLRQWHAACVGADTQCGEFSYSFVTLLSVAYGAFITSTLVLESSCPTSLVHFVLLKYSVQGSYVK